MPPRGAAKGETENALNSGTRTAGWLGQGWLPRFNETLSEVAYATQQGTDGAALDTAAWTHTAAMWDTVRLRHERMSGTVTDLSHHNTVGDSQAGGDFAAANSLERRVADMLSKPLVRPRRPPATHPAAGGTGRAARGGRQGEGGRGRRQPRGR